MKKPRKSIAKLHASLPNAIAYCAVARALRSQHRFNKLHAGLIVLRVPRDASSKPYRAAAEVAADLDGRSGRRIHDSFVCVIGTRKGHGWPTDLADWFEHCCRIIALCKHDEPIPFHVELAADAILEIGDPTVRDITGAWRMSGRGPISRDEAERVLDVPFDILEAVARHGRSAGEVVDRIIDAAARLPARTAMDVASLAPELDDLVGMGDADAWGRELAQDLRDWKAGKIPWSAVDRGILLSGPPGCGKTTFAKALARSCGVELVTGSLAQWQAAGYLNALLKAMRDAFEEAKRKAPSILFIDEIDAFGDRARFQGHNEQYCTEVVAGLLQCLDGVEGRDGVVVVGAANLPERLDPAIMRSGRLDRHVRVSLPDVDARREILNRLFDRRIDITKLGEIAARLPGRSGADLERIAREAKRRARRADRPACIDDLTESLPPLTPLPREFRRRVAIHEAGHAVVGRHLGYGVIQRAVVPLSYDDEAHSAECGRVEFIQDETQLRTLSRIEVELATLLAGAAAENLILGDHAAGVGGRYGSDLHRATVLATAAFRSWGLGGRLLFMEETGPVTSGLAIDPVAYRWVDDMLGRCFQKAMDVLTSHRKDVERLADALLGESVMDGARIDAVMAKQRHRASPKVARRRRTVAA